MAKAFVCYAQRIDTGFRRSIYRTIIAANPTTLSDSKTQLTSITNFKTYLTGVLNANTLVPITGGLLAESITAIAAVVDTFATGVNANLKNSIKVSIISYSPTPGAPLADFVRLVAVKNGVKTTTDVSLVGTPEEEP